MIGHIVHLIHEYSPAHHISIQYNRVEVSTDRWSIWQFCPVSQTCKPFAEISQRRIISTSGIEAEFDSMSDIWMYNCLEVCGIGGSCLRWVRKNVSIIATAKGGINLSTITSSMLSPSGKCFWKGGAYAFLDRLLNNYAWRCVTPHVRNLIAPGGWAWHSQRSLIYGYMVAFK